MSALDRTWNIRRPAGRFLLLLGQMPSEVADARSRNSISTRSMWTAEGAQKGRHRATLPLPAAVVDICAELPRFEGWDFVFSIDGARAGFPPAKSRPSTPRLRRRSGSRSSGGFCTICEEVVRPAWRVCRSSRMSSNGVGPSSGVIKGVAAVYNRFSLSARNALPAAWRHGRAVSPRSPAARRRRETSCISQAQKVAPVGSCEETSAALHRRHGQQAGFQQPGPKQACRRCPVTCVTVNTSGAGRE